MVSLTTRLVVLGVTAAVACTMVIGGVGVLTDDGVASAVHDSGDHPDWVHEANFTLKLGSTEPGTTTDIMFWASLPDTEQYGDGLGEAKFVQMWLPQGEISGDLDEKTCTRDDIVVAGIDRGANNSGVTVDMSLVSNIKNYDISQNAAGQTMATVESYGKEDFGGDHVAAHYSDEAIVKMEDCFKVPSSTGWYRGGIYANGSNYQGEYLEAAGYTPYFAICDCEDRQEAIETLGEPPVTGTGTEGSVIRADRDGVFGESLDKAPPSDWDLSERRDPNAGGNAGGSTGGEPTATEAPTTGGGSGSASTSTATEADPGSGETPAATPTATPTATSKGGGDGGVGASTSTVGGDQVQGDGNGQSTPTASEGPGLGAVAAVLALLASSLLAHRQR